VIAFLFIGQGSALPWVSREVLTDDVVAPLVALASEATGVNIARLLTAGGRELARTEVEQPAMVAVCLGVHRMLVRAGLTPDIVMGHSLGEITAWAAAGAVEHEDAVRLAAIRGRLMAREAARHPGGMVRVIGDREVCEAALRRGREAGSLCITAHNGAEEWVLGGDERALASVLAAFPSTRVPITGPWHTPAIADAAGEFLEALAGLERRPLQARFIANRDGSLPEADAIPALLAGQLVHPVRWVDMIRTAVSADVRRFIAVGPGKTLRALVQRNLGSGQLVEIADSARSIASVASA